jgi:succinate dehydrogenase/fumarate reductase cytochrome b subunit
MALKKLNDLLKKSLRNFLQALKSFKKALVLLEMYLRIFFHAINGLKRVKEVNSNIFKKFSRGYYY